MSNLGLRLTIGVSVAACHLVVSGFLVLFVLASATRPIADPSTEWVIIPFFIVNLPLSIFGCVGLYTNGFLAMLSVPVNSIIWGTCAARFFVRSELESLQVYSEDMREVNVEDSDEEFTEIPPQSSFYMPEFLKSSSEKRDPDPRDHDSENV